MEWQTQLKQHHLRVTQARLAVLELLEKSHQPRDVQDIFEELTKKRKAVCDVATIYRMMEVFEQKGLVKRVDLGDGKLRYEVEGAHHHHLVCEICGLIEPIYDVCAAIDTNEIEKKHQFKVRRHSLELFGVCGKCTKDK